MKAVSIQFRIVHYLADLNYLSENESQNIVAKPSDYCLSLLRIAPLSLWFRLTFNHSPKQATFYLSDFNPYVLFCAF